MTPTIDLSHNEGACNISLRVWGSEGDWLIIQGSNPASQATIEFPKGGGIVEKTITMPLCTSKDQLTFYSNNYKVFLIDYIKITQDVKAGDKVTTITGSVLTEDSDTKSMVMTNPGFSDGHDVLYRVTAMRYDKDSQESHKYYSTSSPSDFMLVKNPNPSGIGSVEAAAENVAGVEGGIVVNAANATTVNVFNLSGQLVASKACGNALVLWKTSSLFLQSFSYKLLEVFASKVGCQDVSVFVNNDGVGNGLHAVCFCHLAVPASKF